MGGSVLRVRMLGSFSLEWNGTSLQDTGNRLQRSWLLLAYILCNRNRAIPLKELIDLLWGEDGSVNPSGVMKTTLHRTRSLLGRLAGAEGPGMILARRGVCLWNPEIEVSLDTDEFESLCRRAGAEKDEERQLETYLQALALYQGDFLSKYSSEMWVLPISAYFHSLYVQTALEVLPLLARRDRQEEAAALCRQALVLEPYSEVLCQHLLRALLALGESRAAAAVYEDMCKQLADNFGVEPARETRLLYQEALQTVNSQVVSMRTVQEQLREEDSGGALMCGYDSFKIIYHAEARAVARSGDAVHLCLLSVSGREALSRRQLDHYMVSLQDLIRSSLRKGDVAARCSVSQFILLLPQATYESSCMVCERLTHSFSDRHPRSQILVRYSVQALTPNV